MQNNKSDEILCKFYHNLFKMKYNNFKINDYSNYANNFFELKKDIDLYNNKYKYLVYNYSLSNYKELLADIDASELLKNYGVLYVWIDSKHQPSKSQVSRV